MMGNLVFYVYTYVHILYLLAIGKVTGVALTCEPVDVNNQCTATWLVSYSLLCCIRNWILQSACYVT